MEQFLKVTREEYHIFTDKDDDDKMKQIEITHADHLTPVVVDVKPLIELIKDILKFSTTTIANGGPRERVVGLAMESLKRKTSPSNFEALAKDIHKISCKISCKCTGGEEDNTMLALIETLSSYSWDSKVVLAMAAFAVSYGGFFFLVGAKNKSKPLETLRSLIEAMVSVTECVVNLKNLPSGHNSLDQSVVQTAVYWTIRSVVACVPHFFGFLSLGHEYTPSRIEDEELSKLCRILIVSHDQIDRYRLYIEENKIFEYYHELLQLFSMIPTDKLKILNALIDTKDCLKPLVQVSSQQHVGVEVLEKKNVLLLISPSLLDANKEEIGILVDLYKNTKQVCQYELLCLSLEETTESKREEFEKLLNMKKMPWYLLHRDHQVINRAVIKYIKEVWHFNNKPILVVLDTQGRVITQNAFPNIRIWGGIDLSITLKTEAQLWSEATWGLELLFQTIEQAKNILQWMKKDNERYIFL
ncbi:protein SIEVE ELEMENT OCCLUSION B-like [Macadamia integrifolia]|uniref:protein SIEVE ELEMENT OCCLUSION B-like n=1 Tax=Macadamia integrifolia TaxID=60698 RepID=UPI001C527465|nr:protein SIEVE ELEMENT OCCLUSION B-like [Macadamia integrifolia]